MASTSKSSREQWSNKMGFILAAIGSAVGLGSIWRFPFVAGVNGGGAFVLIYLLSILLLGLPVLLSEIVMGRSAQKNPIGAYRHHAPNTPWFLSGYIGIVATIIILAFYSTIGGWTLAYTLEAVTGAFGSITIDQAEVRFGSFINNAWSPILWQAAFIGFTILICLSGIQKGIERTNKFLMPLLGIMLIILVVRAVTLPGAMEGVRFILFPDWSAVTWTTFFEALGMAFFSLSVGAGTMITYGSYLSRQENIPSAVGNVVVFSTLVSLAAGLAIFPAVFSLGYTPDAGPALVFITLPAVFAHLPVGSLFAILFFALLSFAALTSAISLLEVPLRYLQDEHGFSRQIIWLVGGGIFLLGIPATLSFSSLADISVIGQLPIFDSMDFVASNVLLPLSGLFVILFVGWKWGVSKMLAEAEGVDGKGIPARSFWPIVIRWVTPLLIIAVFLFQIFTSL
ncbi:sodium-dependent transporter [Desmospora activa]|uniref:Transporter n=1 Tax=Desmospora activa DSM 45169 TaxID=1121389 RepID=A0A2T4ZBP8_9BACL|nr:sodium-dependent transporter [Desmospora activa]PTM59313.1 NSS family neurotransmitter:Na+ symporter [Desmospora activa DSM 45169]